MEMRLVGQHQDQHPFGTWLHKDHIHIRHIQTTILCGHNISFLIQVILVIFQLLREALIQTIK